jgi:hypothetical protein
MEVEEVKVDVAVARGVTDEEATRGKVEEEVKQQARHNFEFVPPAPPVRPPSVFNVHFHHQP